MTEFADPERALERYLETVWHGETHAVVSSRDDATGLAHASLLVKPGRTRSRGRVFTTAWVANSETSRREAFRRLLVELFETGVLERSAVLAFDAK